MIHLKNIIPYEKEIEFPSKIAEITSISLEHEEKITDQEVIGDFIISGDYKVHSISVNKDDFTYRMPFNIELSDRIDRNSINLDISDFTYDIKDNNILVVKIEVDFNYQEMSEQIKEAETIEIQEATEEDDIMIEENEKDLDEEINKLINSDRDDETIEEDNLTKKVVLNTNNVQENTYVTYHVYIVEKDDTVDSICKKYKISQELLHEYNEFETIQLGDKLLIPIYEEE